MPAMIMHLTEPRRVELGPELAHERRLLRREVVALAWVFRQVEEARAEGRGVPVLRAVPTDDQLFSAALVLLCHCDLTRRINMHDSPVGAVLPVARAVLHHATRLRWRASLPWLLPDAVAVGWIIWGRTSRALPPVLVYLRQRKQRSVSPRGPFCRQSNGVTGLIVRRSPGACCHARP